MGLLRRGTLWTWNLGLFAAFSLLLSAVLCPPSSVRAASPLGATFNNDVELKLWTNTAKLVSATNTGTTGQWTGSATQSWAYATQPTNGLGVGKLSAISNITLTATTQTARVQWTFAGGADGVRLWRGPQTTNLIWFLPMQAGVTNFADTGAFTNWVTNGAQTVTATNIPALVLRDGTRLDGAEDLGGGSGTITNITTTVSGLGVVNPGGANVSITGSVSATVTYGLTSNTAYNGAAGAAASNLAAAALASNVWAAAASTTNYVRRTGDTMSGPLTVTNISGASLSGVAWNQTLVLNRLFAGANNSGLYSGLHLDPNSFDFGIGSRGDGSFATNEIGLSQYQSSITPITGSSADWYQLRWVSILGGYTSIPFRVAGPADVNSASGVELYMTTANVQRIRGAFEGNGSGVTNVNADSLNAISGTNYVRGVVINGATNRPDSEGLAQLGTISGGGGAATNIYDRAQLGNIGGTVLLSAGSGYAQEATVTSAVTFAFSTNATDTTAEFSVMLHNPTLFGVTWPTATTRWVEGAPPVMETNAAFITFGFVVENYNLTNYVRGYRRSAGGVQ